jgi:preprotein translocase subunit YajC
VVSLAFFVNGLLLAADKAGGGGGAGADKGDGGGFSQMLPLILIMLLGMYWFLFRPQRKEQSRREAMLTAVKKNDRIITAGGIYGVVANVHREANEVTIKVDETSNTKLRMTLSSIAQVLGEEPSEDTKSK